MPGDPSPGVVTSVIGIFPEWLVEAALVRSFPADRDRRVPGWVLGLVRDHLGAVTEPERLAKLSFAVADAADASALPLFRGWRDAARPDDGAARLGHALIVLRELRGGLHFAALRAVGLSVTQAVALDPGGGRGGSCAPGGVRTTPRRSWRPWPTVRTWRRGGGRPSN